MKTKILISVLILITLFSGCITEKQIKDTQTDIIQSHVTPEKQKSIEVFDISYMKIDDNKIQINVANIGNDPVSAVILKIQDTNTFYIIGDNESVLGHLNPMDYTSAIFNIKKIPDTNNELSLRIEYIDTSSKRNQTEKTIYITDRYEIKESNNISFSWRFGCVKYCGDEGRPGESDGRFDITNTGNVDIPKMKLIIDFYAYSGRFVNTRSTEILFDRNMNNIETTPVNSQGYMFIKVPSQYTNEETWSYAEISLLKNNTRYHVYIWKSVYKTLSDGGQNVMPPINGNVEIES